MIEQETKTLKPHQIRVVDELRELTTKILALMNFREADACKALSHEEQVRLHTQQAYMIGYADILTKRIKAFDHGA